MSNKIKHFTDLQIWQRSHQLFIDLVNDIELFPKKKAAYILVDQILRSCGSIGGNIAEGFNRSKARFLNSLDIALGESNETENWLYKIRDIGFMNQEIAEERLREVRIISRMIASLIIKIRKK